jgi:hypothetical protein
LAIQAKTVATPAETKRAFTSLPLMGPWIRYQ